MDDNTSTPARDAGPPLLILAPPRSCSTVITAMLGCHPQLFAAPELKLFRRRTVAAILDNWPSARKVPIERRRAGLLRGIAQVHDGDQSEGSISCALGWLEARRDWTGSRVLDHLRAEVAPLTFVEKSPDNCSRLEYLDRLLSTSPDVRLLHLVRHPIATASSLHALWVPPRSWELTDAVRRQFDLAVWVFTHQRISDALAKVPADRWRRVRAEDVVNDPETALPPLLDWLGVESTPDAIARMKCTESWEFAGAGPEAALGGGDPNFQSAPSLHSIELPRSVEIPRDWTADPWTSVSALRVAHTFGYC